MKNDYLIEKPPPAGSAGIFAAYNHGNLFQQLYTTADSAIIGRYVGEQTLAAVGASNALTMAFICVAIGGGTGAS